MRLSDLYDNLQFEDFIKIIILSGQHKNKYCLNFQKIFRVQKLQSLTTFHNRIIPRSSRPEVFCWKVFLEMKSVLAPQPVSFFKKRLWHRCFPVIFAKFLRTSFLTEHLGWLLLKGQSDFQTKGLKRERQGENQSTAPDKSSITISCINPIKQKRPFYRCFE